MPPELTWLPKAVCIAGKFCLRGVVSAVVRRGSDGSFSCPPEKRDALEAVLQDSFCKNLMREPACPPELEVYDSAKSTLRLGAALQMASKAFAECAHGVKLADKVALADQWAAEAFAYVTSAQKELGSLALPAARHLLKIRESNVHRDRRDLVSSDLFSHLKAEAESLSSIESTSDPADGPFLQATKDSHESLLQAMEATRSGNALNHKPFSQRLIKAAVLAKAAGAVLKVGTVASAMAGAYARRVGDALPSLAEADVVVCGRGSPDFGVHPSGARSLSSFVTGRADGTLLDVPHVALQAAIILINPRWVAHEFEHVRQIFTCDCRIEDFTASVAYRQKGTEIGAKIEEAHFTRQFGVLF